jgi:hypothetical protein
MKQAQDVQRADAAARVAEVLAANLKDLPSELETVQRINEAARALRARADRLAVPGGAQPGA